MDRNIVNGEIDKEHPFLYVFQNEHNGNYRTYILFKCNNYLSDREAYRLAWSEAALRIGADFEQYRIILRPYNYDLVEIEDLGENIPNLYKDTPIITGISGNY